MAQTIPLESITTFCNENELTALQELTVISDSFLDDVELVTCLEYHWGLDKGDLDLDVPMNKMQVRSDLKDLIAVGRCLVLPPDDINSDIVSFTLRNDKMAMNDRRPYTEIFEGNCHRFQLHVGDIDTPFFARSLNEAGIPTYTRVDFRSPDAPLVTSTAHPFFVAHSSMKHIFAEEAPFLSNELESQFIQITFLWTQKIPSAFSDPWRKHRHPLSDNGLPPSTEDILRSRRASNRASREGMTVVDDNEATDSGRLNSKNLIKLVAETSSRGVKRLRDDSNPLFPSSTPTLVASDQLAPDSRPRKRRRSQSESLPGSRKAPRNHYRARSLPLEEDIYGIDEDALLVYRWLSSISKDTVENLEPLQLPEEQSIARDDDEVPIDVEEACIGLCVIVGRRPEIPYRSDSPEPVKREPELFGSDSSSRREFRRVLLRYVE
ncbi:hypothetical protein C8J56DRAFT_1026151 [Mycena floridula]|nr:hypothetical protein C8J56DRAFT_1026151 [Mycena floridula]